MLVEFINNENFVQQTWKHENKKGQIITICKGDKFKTKPWGYGGYESVVTDKGEWICDVDCKEFNEMFKAISE